MLWIGFVIVVLSSGQVVSDTAFFPTEAECKEASANLQKAINEPSNQAIAYEMQCVRVDKMKKPGKNA